MLNPPMTSYLHDTSGLEVLVVEIRRLGRRLGYFECPVESWCMLTGCCGPNQRWQGIVGWWKETPAQLSAEEPRFVLSMVYVRITDGTAARRIWGWEAGTDDLSLLGPCRRVCILDNISKLLSYFKLGDYYLSQPPTAPRARQYVCIPPAS